MILCGLRALSSLLICMKIGKSSVLIYSMAGLLVVVGILAVIVVGITKWEDSHPVKR
jgi:phosphate starvation-inducible membrane PsiE